MIPTAPVMMALQFAMNDCGRALPTSTPPATCDETPNWHVPFAYGYFQYALST